MRGVNERGRKQPQVKKGQPSTPGASVKNALSCHRRIRATTRRELGQRGSRARMRPYLDGVLEGKVECLGGEITDDVGEVSSPESTHALLGIYAGEAVADTGVTRHFTRLDHRISILVNSTRR